jgi:hypothetical protein
MRLPGNRSGHVYRRRVRPDFFIMVVAGGVMKRFDNPDVIITDVMDSHGKWRANKPAVIFGNERISWAAFTRRINKVANGLIKRGLQKGD